jgi:acyl carrier protein
VKKEEVIERVNKILHQQFEISLEKLKPEVTLFDDLALDSLDAVDMIVYLEENLKLNVDTEKFKNVRTLQNVYDLVLELVASKRS